MKHSFPTRRSSDLLDRFKLRCGKYLCGNSNDPGEKWFERAVALDRHRADLVEQDRRMAITPRPRGAAVVAAKSPKPAPGILLIDADTVGKVTQTRARSEEHKSELQSLMHISNAVFCVNKTNTHRE